MCYYRRTISCLLPLFSCLRTQNYEAAHNSILYIVLLLINPFRSWINIQFGYFNSVILNLVSLWSQGSRFILVRLPDAAARVRAGLSSCKICGRQSGTAAVFLRVLRFPLLSFHRLLHTHHPGLVQQANSGLSKSELSSIPLPPANTSFNHSHNYFTTCDLPPISLFWCQVPSGSRPEISFRNETLNL
jgi:hypothetical protein